VSVPFGRAFPLARVRVPYVHACARTCVRAPDTEVEVCGHNRRRVISDPSVNTRLAPAGSDLHHPPLALPSLFSLSRTTVHMHVRRCRCMRSDSRAQERELLRYAYRSNSSVCALHSRRLRPRNQILLPSSSTFSLPSGWPRGALISVTFCMREMCDVSRSFEISRPAPNNSSQKNLIKYEIEVRLISEIIFYLRSFVMKLFFFNFILIISDATLCV